MPEDMRDAAPLAPWARRLNKIVDQILLRHRFFDVGQAVAHGELKRIEIRLQFNSIDEAESFFCQRP